MDLRRAALLVLLALTAAACTSEVGGGAADDGAARKSARPVYGDTLIEALLGDIQGLIPNITSDSASHTIGDLIYTGLVKRDQNLRLDADLVQGRLQGCRVDQGSGRSHGPRALPGAVRQGAPELGHVDAPAPSARVLRRGGQAPRGSAEPRRPDRYGALPLQGVEDRRE